MGRLDGKVAIVTGASRGVGAATSRVFATRARGRGLRHRRRARAGSGDELAITRSSCTATWASKTDWTAARDHRCSRLGRLDVLANVGGVMHLGLIVDTPPQDYFRVNRVNEVGTFLGIRPAIRPMTRWAVVRSSTTRR